jgi:hypothetical protein
MCPSSGEITVTMRHLVICHSVWMTVWYARWNECFIPPCVPDSHSHRVTNTKCRKDTDISPDDGHTVARNIGKRNKHTKKMCTTLAFIYKIIRKQVCQFTNKMAPVFKHALVFSYICTSLDIGYVRILDSFCVLKSIKISLFFFMILSHHS